MVIFISDEQNYMKFYLKFFFKQIYAFFVIKPGFIHVFRKQNSREALKKQKKTRG